MATEKIHPSLIELAYARLSANGIGGEGDSDGVNIAEVKESLRGKPNLDWIIPAVPRMVERQFDRVANALASGLARQAIQHHREMEIHYPDEQRVEERHKAIYLELNGRFKTSTKTVRSSIDQDSGNVITTDPHFVMDVYTRIVPTLTSINSVGDKRNSIAQNNSFHEVADVAETIMSAKETGSLILYGQICANYATGEEHDADAYAKGLAKVFDTTKIEKVFSFYREIATVCRAHGIRVVIANQQLTADGLNIPALAPACFWGYAKTGKLPKMLKSWIDMQESFHLSYRTKLAPTGTRLPI